MDDRVGLLDHLTDSFGGISRTLQDFAGVVLFVALFILFVLCCVLVGREVKTYHSLKPHRRRRYVVRPTSAHEWSVEDVETWAAHLTTVQRRVNRFLDRPAHALRIRLASTPQGPRYTIEGSWRLDLSMRNPVLPGIAISRLRPRPNPGGQHPGSGDPRNGRSRS